MLGFGTYNYPRFTRDLLQEGAAAFTGPEPGTYAPDFKASTLSGEPLRLRDYQGNKNVLLVFGSATCPMTAGFVGGINRLYDRFRGEVDFLFVYVREAHPGEKIPAHSSMEDKIRAATQLRDEEDLAMPIVIDDLRGSIHRKYSRLPNPAYLIDKSGRVAFRSMWTQPATLGKAIEELLELQQERGVDHVVVNGGQDVSMPLSYAVLHAHRALERGGQQATADFREALGLPGRSAAATSRVAESLMVHPGRILAIAAVTAAVLAGGLYAGFELRKRRLGSRRNPYRAYEKETVKDTDTGMDYGAVGI